MLFRSAASAGGVRGASGGAGYNRGSDSSAFMALPQGNESATWAPNASAVSLTAAVPPQTPYFDDARTPSAEFDPYLQNAPRVSNASRQGYGAGGAF